MENEDKKLMEEIAGALASAPEALKGGYPIPSYSFEGYKAARAYIKEKTPTVQAAIKALGISPGAEDKIFNAWRIKALGLPFPDADRQTAEELEKLADASTIKEADPYLLYGEIYMDYIDYLAALRQLEALADDSGPAKWMKLQGLLDEFSVYPEKARPYFRIFSQVAIPLEVFNGVESHNLNSFLDLCRRWAEIGEYFVTFRLALYALNMPVEVLNEQLQPPATLQVADDPAEKKALQESLKSSARTWADGIKKEKGKTISISVPFVKMLSSPIRASRKEEDTTMGVPLEKFAEKWLKDNPEYQVPTKEELAIIERIEQEGRKEEDLTNEERLLLAKKNSEAITSSILAKTLEAIVLLSNYKPAYNERDYRVIETYPEELARLAYPNISDASQPQKKALMAALYILDGLFILTSTMKEGMHFQRCITIQSFDTSKKGEIKKMVIQVYNPLLKGSPYLIDERTYFEMGQALREGKRGSAGRFKYMIIEKTHIRESAALESIFGYKTELDLAQFADNGRRGDNYRNAVEYISRHKADDRKKLAEYFKTYKKKGLIAEYSSYMNADGEKIYSWKVNKENGIYTSLAR